AMFSAPWKHQTLHALIACYQATAFAMAGIHAAVLLRHPTSPIFRKALAISLTMACVTAVLQPLSGDISARAIAVNQPSKLAAAEAHFVTGSHAPLALGGLADPEERRVDYALEIPSGLSLLAFHDPKAVVIGLDRVPREDWPP